jgi:hypothetical protein
MVTEIFLWKLPLSGSEVYFYSKRFRSFRSVSYDRSKPLPKRAVYILRSRASSFSWEYPLLSLRLSSSFLHLLPHLPFTSVPPFIFPSKTCCRRQFLHKIWPIQLAFRLLISCRIFLCSLTLSNPSSFLTWLVQDLSCFKLLTRCHGSRLLLVTSDEISNPC